MDLATALTTTVIAGEYLLKFIAVGTVPENRRPSSSSAWLLIILFVPVIGFPLYWTIGSPWVRGRRSRIQAAANRTIADFYTDLPSVPADADPVAGLAGVVEMNRGLTGLPCVTGATEGLYDDTAELFAAMTEAVAGARTYIQVEYYIVAWDRSTSAFFDALAAAAARGVVVRLLMDHLGSRAYPEWKEFQRKLTEAGVDWRLMMPLLPLQRKWRRPDLRNHRKLLIVDGDIGFVGSHNLIDPAYGSTKNDRAGRHWKDLSLQVSGDIVLSMEAVFATDWFTETGELLDTETHFVDKPDLVPGELDGRANAMQLVCSGPGFPTEPNLRMFISLMYLANRSITITSPYFVPDEALLTAITSAAHRGVRVELFVGEQADQFLVGHAQRSFYRALLEAGVVIHLYPAPTVLHAKYLTIDDTAAAIGSSNMDFRSYALNYEVMLLGYGGDLVDRLHENDARYRSLSRVLTLEEWSQQSWTSRYVDNVCRLTAALM